MIKRDLCDGHDESRLNRDGRAERIYKMILVITVQTVIKYDFHDGHEGSEIHARHVNHLESKLKRLKSSGDESMKAQQIKLDLSGMPPHAKLELLDFYEFLRQKYGVEQTAATPKPRTRKKAFEAFLSNTVPVEKITRFSRDDLHERMSKKTGWTINGFKRSLVRS